MVIRDFVVQEASIEKAEEILELQKLAYKSEAEIYDDLSIPPLHQTMEEIKFEFSHQLFLSVELNQKIVGSVRIYVHEGTGYIGKLIVHPDYQNQGIGSRLLLAAEYRFPEAERFELFTGHRSVKNLYLYKKNGYRIFRQKKMSEKLEFVFLEKLKS